MNTYNPYEAPKADISASVVDEAGIEQVASAQKLIIYSILTYFAAVAIKADIPILHADTDFAVLGRQTRLRLDEP